MTTRIRITALLLAVITTACELPAVFRGDFLKEYLRDASYLIDPRDLNNQKPYIAYNVQLKALLGSIDELQSEEYLKENDKQLYRNVKHGVEDLFAAHQELAATVTLETSAEAIFQHIHLTALKLVLANRFAFLNARAAVLCAYGEKKKCQHYRRTRPTLAMYLRELNLSRGLRQFRARMRQLENAGFRIAKRNRPVHIERWLGKIIRDSLHYFIQAPDFPVSMKVVYLQPVELKGVTHPKRKWASVVDNTIRYLAEIRDKYHNVKHRQRPGGGSERKNSIFLEHYNDFKLKRSPSLEILKKRMTAFLANKNALHFTARSFWEGGQRLQSLPIAGVEMPQVMALQYLSQFLITSITESYLCQFKKLLAQEMVAHWPKLDRRKILKTHPLEIDDWLIVKIRSLPKNSADFRRLTEIHSMGLTLEAAVKFNGHFLQALQRRGFVPSMIESLPARYKETVDQRLLNPAANSCKNL